MAYQFSTVYKDLALRSDEQFLPTPVTSLPSGNETGNYLAIDVGGTNLRVAFIELLGEEADNDSTANGPERSRETIQKAQRPRFRRTLEKAWPIGEHLKMDKAEDLFAWIGDCIAEVVADRLTSDAAKIPTPEELQMGITFSFPMMYAFPPVKVTVFLHIISDYPRVSQLLIVVTGKRSCRPLRLCLWVRALVLHPI